MKRSSPFRQSNRLLAVVFCLLAMPAMALAQGAGSTSTNFEKIGMGARAAGMGDAFTAVADDATAVFWNPAGLYIAPGTEFSLTHGVWLQGVDIESLAFSQNLDTDGAFGGAVQYLGTGSFAGALEDPNTGAYAGVGPDISASNYEATAAYSQRLGNWFGGDFFKKSYMGLEATVVGQNVITASGAGAAFSLGYLYEVTRKTFYLGAVLLNVGTQVQDYTQPLFYKLGGSYRLHNTFLKKDQDIFAVDLEGQNDTGFRADLGDEYKMSLGRNDVALRLGYRTGSDLGGVTGLTTGVGLAHHFDDMTASLDYAFVPYGVLGDTHRVSLNLVLGGSTPAPIPAVNTGDSFVLGKEYLPVEYSVKSEEPIDHWTATILDSSGMLVKTISGTGNPPNKLPWDGTNQTGDLVPQGNYSVHLSVTDDDDQTADVSSKDVFAKWLPKEVPYQYSYSVPGDLLFNSGDEHLQARGYEAIQKAVAAIHQKFPDSVIVVAGHTDNVPLTKGARFADNQQLSLARAKSVVDYLVQNGVSPSQLSAVGYGDTKPIVPNDTPDDRAKNRRVELVVSGVQEAMAPELVQNGLDLMDQKRYRDALDLFLKAVESDSRNAQAYRLAGDCYLTLGNVDLAAKAYQQSYKWNPSDTYLKNWLDQYGSGGTKPSASTAPSSPASNGPPGGPAARP